MTNKTNSQVYLLQGNQLQCQEILNKIKQSLGNYDLFVYDETYSYEYVEEKIMEYSCFGKARLVLLNKWPKTSKTRNTLLNNFKKILSNVPYDCTIVLNNLNVSSESFISHVSKIGRIYKYDKILFKNEAKGYLNKYVQEHKKLISEQDIAFMLDTLCAYTDKIDVDKLNIFLIKIEDYIGNKKRIRREDIMSVGFHSSSFIIWNFFNALDNKDVCLCFKLLTLLLSTTKNIESEIVTLVSIFIWKYKLLLAIKSGVENKINREDIWREISKLNKLERSGLCYYTIMKEKQDKQKNTIPQYTEKFFYSLFKDYSGKETLKCYKLENLFIINYILKQFLVRIRSGCNEAEIVIIFKFILMIMCGKMDKLRLLFLESKYVLMFHRWSRG